MKNLLSIATVAAALAVAGGAAQAATVLSVGSQAGGAFTTSGGTVAVTDPNNHWDTSATSPTSQWIWAANSVNGTTGVGGGLTFTLNFTLAAAQVASASLAGMIGFDDGGTVALNGHNILTEMAGNNYSLLSSYGTTSWFQEGVNTLTYVEANYGGGPAGFRATAVITAADVSAVPLPATFPLLFGGLAAAGFALRRKRRAA